MANFLIIGGSSGIGKALAVKLDNAGHQVYATWNTKEITVPKGNIVYKKLDVLDDVMEVDWLPETIDGLVYCPGAIVLKPFHRIKPEEFMHDFNLQVLGAVKSIQAVLPRLRKSQSASIVLFSTVAVQRGFNFHSLIATSKGAVEGLVRSLAAEFAPAIRVNGIAPSLTDTPLAERLVNTAEKRDANAQRHPMKRIGAPEDMANAAAFLLSAEASFITGQILHVDGGISDLKV